MKSPRLASLALGIAWVGCLLGCDERTLRIEQRGEGSARVRSDPPRLDCPLDGPCEGSFPTGANVTLT